MKKEFITYGFIVDTKKIPPIKNTNINKPRGGLWGSPVDSRYGWKDWCESENFRLGTFSVYTKWSLSSDARILTIDSLGDLKSVFQTYPLESEFSFLNIIDFERLSKDFDGILLTADGNAECHFGDGLIDMNSWDCESIVVWNPDVVEITGLKK